MAPAGTPLQLSPAELSFIRDSLAQTPPIRPDGRSPSQFRPLVAEADILPSANGSARVCFSDGTEAIVGVKAEVEKSVWRVGVGESSKDLVMGEEKGETAGEQEQGNSRPAGEDAWIVISIEVPGYRDDDALPTFLSSMLTEALLAGGELKNRLWINRRFHWKLHIDILLLSAPLSYPLPLLSITTHLALLSARLPRLKSEQDEDPLFDDDWEASSYLYPQSKAGTRPDRPPVTLLAIAVEQNFVFDPSREELAAADAVIALSVGTVGNDTRNLRLLSIRTIDPPARSTVAGVPNSLNTTTGAAAPLSTEEAFAAREAALGAKGVWNPPRGGVKRQVLTRIMKAALEPGGAAQEVMDGLVAVET